MLTPPAIWGTYARLLGVVYFVAFASLYWQAAGLAGTRGITPVSQVLRKIAADYPGPRRFLYFPTLLWLDASDRMLRLLIAAGALSALLVVQGGPWSGAALFACWACYLSLDVALDLIYPWDSLLLEAGFLALFLPPLLSLPAVQAVAAPLPPIAWAHRWLFFRLMLGFGKQKFLGASWSDLDYLRNFFVNQPMPTRLGWYAHRLPLWLVKPALAATFVVEMLLPWLAFFAGWPRLLAAAATAGLMIAIQLVGNYGFFNLLSVALCVPLLDLQSSVFETRFPPATPGELAATIVAAGAFVGGLLHLPFNHWCTRTFLHWPPLVDARPVPLRLLLAVYRGLSPFRVLHAYGVFPPKSGPPARIVPLIEGTADGRDWKEYRYRSQPADARAASLFEAPFQARLDFSLLYEAFGHNGAGFLSSLTGTGNPYRFSHFGPMERLVERLFEQSPPVLALFAGDPFPRSSPPPAAIRVRLVMLTPRRPAECRRSGEWWLVRDVGVHMPARAARPELWQRWLLDPEMFHWDDVLWKRRAPALRLPDARDDDRFWTELGPCMRGADWDRLAQSVGDLRGRLSADELLRMEKTLGRLAFALGARLEPHYSGEREPRLVLPSHFHLGLFVHHVIGRGREAYERLLGSPEGAAATASELTLESGLYPQALFWYETLRFQAWKLRLAYKSWGRQALQSPIRGVPDIYPLLDCRFEDVHERAMPQLLKVSSGAWRIEEAAS